jgi:tRNA nucleotidyltransferase (CCA-adding enzyme)
MRALLPKKLIALANDCPAPLYAVGGSVRDFLAGMQRKSGKPDWDITSTMPVETLEKIAREHGFEIKSCYKNTGTLKLKCGDGEDYEYTRFRSDKYVRGIHTPTEIFFTEDITLDAKRRDFTANAVYYHIQADEFIDPLDGITAIRERRLSTVAPAKKVFGEDGLRLMRLARFCAELGFTPDSDCLLGATKNASLIKDIAPERIFAELSAILVADEKYGVKDGHFRGLQILDTTRVLDEIIPELTLGRNLTQRKDFHDYDVLNHSFHSVLHADISVRLPAFLHDIGKPLCHFRDGTSYLHPQEGEILCERVLKRLKAPKKTIDKVKRLTLLHMYDLNGQVREPKLRRFLVENYDILDELLLVKQADYSGCKDDLSVAPTVKKWKELLEKMRKEKVPFSLKEMAIKGDELLSVNIPKASISTILKKLLLHLAVNPEDNTKERLLLLATKL